MTTLREWFDKFTERTGEVPTHVVFGGDSWYLSDEDDAVMRRFAMEPSLRDQVQRFAKISAETLDKEFNDGYGGNNSPNLCAWSPSWVIFNDNYDGAEGIQWVPRKPIAHRPVRPGGG